MRAANDTDSFNPFPIITVGIFILSPTAAFNEDPILLDLPSVERRPVSERILRIEEVAISYAAYRTLPEYYFVDSLLPRRKMRAFESDHDDH